jgi:hypothetical protein
LYFAVADAACANANTARGALYQRTDGLQINIPAALRQIMSVADAVTELRAAATNFANSCHMIRKSPYWFNVDYINLLKNVATPSNWHDGC